MNSLVPRGVGEISRSGYAEEELMSIYALAVMLLENGSLKQAEGVLLGLIDVAPQFMAAFLGLSFIRGQDGSYDAAQTVAEAGLRIAPDSPVAMLFLISFLITTGDIQSAGTYLGEIADRIETNEIQDPSLIRFFRAQMVRFQNREG